jgi:hypothetical protein
LGFAPATAVANQPPDFERFSILLTAAVRAIQSLPVQANLLDKDMTSIEDANLPSKKVNSSRKLRGTTKITGKHMKNLN